MHQKLHSLRIFAAFPFLWQTAVNLKRYKAYYEHTEQCMHSTGQDQNVIFIYTKYTKKTQKKVTLLSVNNSHSRDV